jgi:uncharacterized protein YjbI with pentapeptide repeats
MRPLVLACSFLLGVLCAFSIPSVTEGARYTQTNGHVVDPILDLSGDPHSYSGIDLTPGAEIAGAALVQADLAKANLQSINLQGANLMEANLAYAKIGNLTNANLRRANLYYAGFLDAHLGGADLRGADLTGAFYLSRIASGSSKPIYSESTIFKWAMSGHHSGEDSFNPAEAGWVFLSDAVPEPATLLLALLALAAAPLRVRCG